MSEKPHINAIAAVGKNRELGAGNELLWRIPDDFKRMRELTKNAALIMGRKTYESIGRPLPGRLNIIITRDATYHADACTVVHSLDEALDIAKQSGRPIFIFGGAQIYAEALPVTDTLYLTIIDDSKPEADTFFPEYAGDFCEVARHGVHEYNGIKYEWVDYKRCS